MISVVICHRDPRLFAILDQNIQETIGVAYEIVKIDNTRNSFTIFEAYNHGVSLAKFDVLCFAHEDIIFHTKNWGQKVIEHFKDDKTGIIGNVGSHYMPCLPGGWWNQDYNSSNLIQSTKGEVSKPWVWSKTTEEKNSVNAVILDGLWFCIPRRVMQKVRFDDVTFNGFHCYDTDICLQILAKGYDVKIVLDILIEHFFSGSIGSKWLLDSYKVYYKWKDFLPQASIPISKFQVTKSYIVNLRDMLLVQRRNNMGFALTLKLWGLFLTNFPLKGSMLSPLNAIYWLCNHRVRLLIYKYYPDISYSNPIGNSLKYIVKKKCKRTTV